jgi:hypothetical protein
MGEKETMTGGATGRVAAGAGPAGIAIGDQGTTENPHGSSGGGGVSHGPLFPHGGEMPTHPAEEGSSERSVTSVEDPGVGGPSPATETTIIKSKSNITNN